MAPQGGGGKSGGCRPKAAHFMPQNSHFWPKTAPKPSKNGKKKGKGSYTPRAPQLPCDEEAFLALLLRDMSKKRPKNGKNGRKWRCLSQIGPKRGTGRILGYVAQIRIPRAPSPPGPPHFLWFPSLRIAQQATTTPVPVVPLVQPERSTARARLGPRVRPLKSPGPKKLSFSKLFLDDSRCSNKCF